MSSARLSEGGAFSAAVASSAGVRLTLYIPETLNDGTPVPAELLSSYEAELCEIAGGFTLIHAIGAWRSSTDCREPLRLYSIDVDDLDGCLKRLQALAHVVLADLAQEEVYVTVTPVGVAGVYERAVMA